MYRIISFFVFLLLFTACQQFLNVAPDRSLAVLTSVDQYEHLLSFDRLYQSDPSIQEFGTDEFYISHDTWDALYFHSRNAYVWAADIYEGSSQSGITQDWNNPYYTIYNCNVVLDGLAESDPVGNLTAYNNVKGHALFLRAFYHYQLYQLFGQPYRPGSADTDLGIPLRLTANPDAAVKRASVTETLDQITTDLSTALGLLLARSNQSNQYWSSKAAASALLSRIYLVKQEYEAALSYADESLSYQSALLDLNDLSSPYRFPLMLDNPEVIFLSLETGHSGIFLSGSTFADSTLVNLFDATDIRKQTHFRWNDQQRAYNFNSLYSGTSNPFSGLATDEVYLNRAECRARVGDNTGALEDLNLLRSHRYESAYFIPVTETENLLDTILAERRKELVFRSIRWADLRRLNQDPAHATSLKRVLNGQVYELPPNDPRYTYPIPPNETQLSNLPQNTR